MEGSGSVAREGAAPGLRAVMLRYSAGLLATALGIAGRLGLQLSLDLKLPYVTFFASALLAAWLGGAGPGLLCVALSAAAADWFWLPPVGSFAVADSADLVGLFVYVALSSTMVVLMSAERRASRRVSVSSSQQNRSLEEIHAIVERMSDSFYALDRGFRFTYLNRKAAEDFGRSPAELVGKTIWEALPELAGTALEDSVRDAMRRREPVQFAAHLPATQTPADVYIYPTASGGVSIFVRDVSVRRAFERGEERMEEILRSATDAIITIDASERISVFSAGAEQIFRCSAAEAIGQPIEGFIPERFRRTHHDFIAAFGETGVSSRQMGAERVLAARRADGEEFPMEARISQSVARGEKLYTVILRDVTERKQAEREREQLLERARASAEEAARANRTKDEFLATVSHELRTPLTPILAWTRMLRNRELDEETATRGLETIERAAMAQAQLVDDLLDISRIVAGKMRLDIQRVEIASAIEAAVESLKPAAAAKDIRLQVVLDPRGGFVSADHGRLQQIVWNLLSNAIKFTPKGGRVQVVLQRINSHVEIVVRDTGKGIPREFLPYVFDRFRQSEPTTTRVQGGLGLGLAIARHLVELHGGTVSCDSPGAGAGSVFTVALPLAPLQRPLTPDETHPTVGTTAGVILTPALEGLRVLLVDDERDTLEALAMVLAAAGAEVRTASSVSRAFEVLSAWQPGVIVSDIGMPGEDGYTLIRRLRELPAERGGRVPAVALTAYARVQDRVKVLAAGFQMHTPKPIEPAELVAVVASAAALEIKGA
jgi:PAS domain S-box-containing protein